MAKSYSSYFREREKDKPYRGAELALGFLGELISSKNQQALQYDKLSLEKEKADALKDYREQTLAANVKQIDPRKGPAYQYNPETRSYDIIEGVGGAGARSGAGGTNWGELYADMYKRDYLDGLIEYGDEDGDGVADRTYIGPDAELFRKYKSAKGKNETGWEGLHPDVVVEGYRNAEEPSPDILDYFNDVEKYKDRYGDYELLMRIAKDPYAKEDDARQVYQNIEKKNEPKKMTTQQRMGAQNLLNRRNELRAHLEGSRKAVRYSFDDTWDGREGEASQESYTVTAIEMTEERRKEFISELSRIEETLNELGVAYSKYTPLTEKSDNTDPPYGPQKTSITAPWVK
jgi:hypothetical protein